MQISKFLFILLLTVGSCNNTVKNEISVVQNKKSVIKNKTDYSIIELIEDSKKRADYEFNNSGRLMKISEYLNNGELENEINFEYKDDKIDFVFLGSNKSKDDWLSNYYIDIELYNKFLIEKSIKIDKPFMIVNEVSDLQNLISNIQDFQKSR
ncbi:hypothetical protein [Flavobacterium sp. CLA17]|uniref:hypothetical protein n=1 Tax=Flavobacterium sp. CLA17 TaxID=2724135 RepID=UPI001491639C|nr:hypothetical protein [Flavobacterium sp. CLA17]QSB26485.1 hypothetical protein HAV12_019285 [Flavobacterium sp. CLA17]